MLSFAAVVSSRHSRLIVVARMRQQQSVVVRKMANSTALARRVVNVEERARVRAARKEQANRFLQQQQNAGGDGAAVTAEAAAAGGAAGSSSSNQSSSSFKSMSMSRYLWYLGPAIISGLVAWAYHDENSPPAKVLDMLGIMDFVEQIRKPTYDKLLPDWSQMPNVPQDMPIPPTLVLDLEQTLVSATWDRKYGWRHAKRPHVDKFLRELTQYYEIVLYTSSTDFNADPVVTNLDRDGCILHRLYRDATYYHNGAHVKDLKRLNRNYKKIIIIDDDPSEVQFDKDHWIPVKPYTDPTDRSDTTLLRLIPFLQELALEGYDDFPAVLAQYEGMDADEIADEQERRVHRLRELREQTASRGLGGFARGRSKLPEPELPPMEDVFSLYGKPGPQMLTAKDIAGAAPPTNEETSGFMGWMNQRQKDKEEHQMRKMEKWNDIMMKRHKRKMEEAAAAQGGGK